MAAVTSRENVLYVPTTKKRPLSRSKNLISAHDAESNKYDIPMTRIYASWRISCYPYILNLVYKLEFWRELHMRPMFDSRVDRATPCAHRWAYREGRSTKLLLAHLSEIWRTAIDANKEIAVAFVDFRKAFECV